MEVPYKKSFSPGGTTELCVVVDDEVEAARLPPQPRGMR